MEGERFNNATEPAVSSSFPKFFQELKQSHNVRTSNSLCTDFSISMVDIVSAGYIYYMILRKWTSIKNPLTKSNLV